MSEKGAEITAGGVIRAVYDLHDLVVNDWPTAEEVAEYLRVDEDDVLEILRGLKRQRIFDDRRRKGRREWRRWGAA